MAVTRKFDEQIVVPCTAEMKRAIEALAEREELSNADIIRRCVDAYLPTLIKEFQAARDARSTESHKLAV